MAELKKITLWVVEIDGEDHEFATKAEAQAAMVGGNNYARIEAYLAQVAWPETMQPRGIDAQKTRIRNVLSGFLAFEDKPQDLAKAA